MNIKSLEDVVRGYLKLAEEKTEEARQQSQQAVVDIDDLDQVTTPERYILILHLSILLNLHIWWPFNMLICTIFA